MADNNSQKRVRTLKELREGSGRTAVWIASTLGVTRQTVNRWEKGDSPGLDDAVLLAMIFGLPLEDMAASFGFTREWAEAELESRIEARQGSNHET
jgi:DNA-binding XRE family transcriptional regulator